MALQSTLFRGDTALEAAAVSDQAHIVPGARGDHVRKIQQALIDLDGATITPDGAYGPATAAAVLAYKRKRDIVNRSYQTQADNIVGKMTMASLDGELVQRQSRAASLEPFLPPASPHRSRSLRPILAFGVKDGGVAAPSGGSGLGVARAPAPIVAEQIIEPGKNGSILMVGGVGGTLVRFQNTSLSFSPTSQSAISALQGAKAPGAGFEEIDVATDPQTFVHKGGVCGETFFQWFRQSDNKRSGVVRVLVLVPVAQNTTPRPQAPPAGVAGGLLSTIDTPLQPLPGRRINLFGRGEANGCEDYSSNLPFCTDNGVHRPWTDDPRKPQIGIPDKSVQNISLRGSPVEEPTIREILRIGVPGCRVTITGEPKRTAIPTRQAFFDTKLATPEFDIPSPNTPGHDVLIFRLK